MKKILAAGTTLTLFLGIIGGIVMYDDRLAKSDELKEVKGDIELLGKRLQQKIVSDRIHNLQKRIWALEDRYGGVGIPNAPQHIKGEYRQLRVDLEQAKRELERK